MRSEIVVLTLPDGRRMEVMVVDLRGDRCRLGFTAPEDVAIHRSEVQAAIDNEKIPPGKRQTRSGHDGHAEPADSH